MTTIFRCRSCDQTFGSKGARDGHRRLTHADTLSFKHPDGTRETLRKTANGKFLCPVDTCAKRFGRGDSLKRHQERIHAHGPEAVAIHPGDTDLLVNLGLCITPSPLRTPPILTDANLCIIHHEGLVLLVCLVEHEALLWNNVINYRGIVDHVRKHRLDMSPSYGGGSTLDRADCEQQLLAALEQFNFTRLDEASMLPFTREPEARLRPPVPGIVILHGFSCKKCTYFCREKRTMDNHRLAKHNDLSIHDIRKECQVQRLAKVGHKYFGVLHHNLDLDGDQGNLVMKDFEEHTESTRPEIEPPIVELAPWLRESGWHDIAAEFMPEGIPLGQVKAQMLKPPKDDKSPLSYVSRVVAIYMDRIQNLAHGAVEYRLRRLVEKTSPDDDVAVGFNPLYSPTSWDRYSDLMTALILCLLRSRDDNNNDNNYKLFRTNRRDLEGALGRLMSQLLGMDESSVEDVDLHIIHEVMLLLWTPEMPETFQATRAADCLFTRFLILDSLVKVGRDPTAEGYGFRPVRHLTQPMAILKYWARAVILMHLAQHIWNQNPTTTTLHNDEAQRLLRYLSDVALPTPFTTICQYMRLATRITSGTPTWPRLVPLGTRNEACLIDNEAITLHAFRDMVHSIAAEADTVLNRDVLLRLKIDWIEDLLKESHAIHDDMNDASAWYAFATDPRNRVLQQHRTDLIDHLFRNPTIKGHFILAQSEAHKILWNNASLRRFMVSCDKLLELLNLIIHFAVGLPARGEEYKSFLIRNTGRAERTFFWAATGFDDDPDNHDYDPATAVELHTIALFQTYHKGANTGAPMKPIVRRVPYPLRALFLAYFCLVRPVQSYVARILWGSEVCLMYENNWFVGMGKRLTGDDLSISIRNAFQKYCGVPFGLSEYRHLAAYFSEKIRKQYDAAMDDLVDVAGGHTTETAGHHYARSQRDWRAMDGHFLRGLTLLVNGWQKLLYFSGTSANITRKGVITPSTPPPPGTTSTTVRPRIDINVQMDRVSERVRLVCVPGYGEPSSSSPTSSSCCCVQNVDSSLMHIRHETTVQAYAALCKMGHTRWKSNEQAIAVALAIENTIDFVAILPTGSGKSLVFMAPSTLIDKTVIVVVPFKALVVSHLAECRKAKIGHGLYTGGAPLHPETAPAIVFVVVDTLGESDAFGTFLGILCARDRLHSIVLDKIHTLQCKYRPTMRNLILAMKQQCQIIGLMASLPPKEQFEIELILGARLHWVRSSTVRPNIQYTVAEVHDVDEEIVQRLRQWKISTRADVDRALVYCLTRDEVEGMAALLQSRNLHCIFLHSGFSTPDTTEILEKWESGSFEIMVATAVIGYGYNYHAVKLVIHRGTFRTMEKFHQESGRAGRDGGPAMSCVISSQAYRDHASHTVGANGLQIPHKWIQEKRTCRRFALHAYVDGKPQVCFLIPGAIPCDICATAARDDQRIHDTRREFEGGATPQGKGNSMPSRGSTTTVVARLRPVLINERLEEARNDVRIIRKFSEDGKKCLLCWSPRSRSFEIHAVTDCPHARLACFKCLGQHRSQDCSNKFPGHPDTCFKCHFPHQPDRMGFHQGLYGTQCQDPSGERLRLFMWNAWRDNEVRSKLFRSIPEIKGKDDREFCEWVVSPRQGAVGNNFVRIVATIVRMKHHLHR